MKGMFAMREGREWDWPPTKRYHRRPRVEVLEPPESIRARFDITIQREQRPSPWIIAGIVIALLLLWRFKLGLLMLAVLVGPERIGAALFLVAILALIAWREHRAGREF
jgi:hypothetical protein